MGPAGVPSNAISFAIPLLVAAMLSPLACHRSYKEARPRLLQAELLSLDRIAIHVMGQSKGVLEGRIRFAEDGPYKSISFDLSHASPHPLGGYSVTAPVGRTIVETCSLVLAGSNAAQENAAQENAAEALKIDPSPLIDELLEPFSFVSPAQQSLMLNSCRKGNVTEALESIDVNSKHCRELKQWLPELIPKRTPLDNSIVKRLALLRKAEWVLARSKFGDPPWGKIEERLDIRCQRYNKFKQAPSFPKWRLVARLELCQKSDLSDQRGRSYVRSHWMGTPRYLKEIHGSNPTHSMSTIFWSKRMREEILPKASYETNSTFNLTLSPKDLG